MHEEIMREIIRNTLKGREPKTGFRATDNDVKWITRSAMNGAKFKAAESTIDGIRRAIEEWEVAEKSREFGNAGPGA